MKRGAISFLPGLVAREQLRAGKHTGVRRDAAGIEIEQKDGSELAQISFIITDGSKDRYGDTVAVDGWDFKAFGTNPVLLWAHDYSMPPVGNMSAPWKTVGNKIKATVDRWVPREVSEFAWSIEQQVRQGFLKTVSVGFMPTEFSWNDDYSVNYLQQELLEVSVTPVPANANAIVAAKSAGLWVPELDQWVRRTLDEKKPGTPFDFAQAAFAALKPVQVQSVGTDSSEDEPITEIVELTAAVKANTAAQLALVGELKREREEREELQRRVRVANAGLEAAAVVEKALKRT